MRDLTSLEELGGVLQFTNVTIADCNIVTDERLLQAREYPETLESVFHSPKISKFGVRRSQTEEHKRAIAKSVAFCLETGMAIMLVEEFQKLKQTEIGDDPDFLAVMFTSFNVEYQFTSLDCYEPPQDLLVEYGATYVLSQAWPYFREYYQNACQRIGVPFLVMPMKGPAFQGDIREHQGSPP